VDVDVPAADELRPVTVLFADLVGSTSLGERLALDEVKALVGECVSRMAGCVEQYGGVVQAYQGDGICAYFGVPRAHEDDAERAARAGLEIVEALRGYAREVEVAWGVSDFGVRVGLNSGPAAVGKVGPANDQQVALGDTTNVAARLQAIAEPGTVVVGDDTARLLEQRFVVEPLGERSVKGRAQPVQVWRLVGRRAAEREAPAGPLVGREREVATLQEVAEDLVASGRGQLVFLTGDAGIGKTRLLRELRSRVSGEATWLEGACASYGGAPYQPFVDALRNWLGVGEGEPSLVARTRLRAKLGGEEAELEQLLGAGAGQGDPRAAYVRWLGRLVEERPVVVALEDVHWADESTVTLARDVAELAEHAPLLLVATLRADRSSAGWQLHTQLLSEHGHRATAFAIPPLDDAAAGRLLTMLLPGGLDEQSEREILERAGGNALYVEELLQTLVAGGGIVRGRTWTLTPAAAELPAALERLLVARIDLLLPSSRRLAQLAAVAGHEFGVRLLEQARGADEGALQQGFTALLRAEILRERARRPEVVYAFKHVLLREAALATLTPADRRALHGRIARGLEQLHGGTTDEVVEQLAEHYARSDELAKALEYLERAGAKAAAVGAPGDADRFWRRAAKVARRLGDSAAESRVERLLSGAS